MKKGLKWLSYCFSEKYKVSNSFLEEMNKQLREQYEKQMGHKFDVDFLFIEPIVENRLVNLKKSNNRYYLNCQPNKTEMGYGKFSIISWGTVDSSLGLIDPSMDVTNIPMDFRWEEIYISPQYMGYYKRGKVNLERFIDKKLPFETSMDELREPDFLIKVKLTDFSKVDQLTNVMGLGMQKYNTSEPEHLLHNINDVSTDTKKKEIVYHINASHAKLKVFLTVLFSELENFQLESNCIKKVFIENI